MYIFVTDCIWIFTKTLERISKKSMNMYEGFGDNQ